MSWSRSGKGSGGTVWQDTGAEEFKTRAAIHLTFDHFEPINLAFYLASAPRRVHRRADRRNVFLKAIGKAHNVPEFTVFGSFDPLS